MIRPLPTLLALLCAVGLHAHPGHSPLESNLAHLEQWLPLVLFIAAFALIGFVRRRKS